MIGFHASHEQFAPSELLRLAQAAERAGFQSIFCSDHFHPWGTKQGQSGYSFAWLGAALQATSLPVRTICCPFGRYHPALIAQAVATLAEMFEQRVALVVGTGQTLNEHITGRPWPLKAQRMVMLRESIDIIRRLWRGETVTHHGHVTVEEAKLFTRGAHTPLLFGAAITPQSARQLAPVVDGIVTTSADQATLREFVAAFREGGGAGKPMWLKVGLSYASTSAMALKNAHDEWKNACFPNHVLTEIRTPEQFDALGEKVSAEHVRQSLRVSADIEEHVEWLRNDRSLGFSEIFLHNVGRNQAEFIDVFGKRVLPALGS